MQTALQFAVEAVDSSVTVPDSDTLEVTSPCAEDDTVTLSVEDLLGELAELSSDDAMEMDLMLDTHTNFLTQLKCFAHL